MTGGDINISEKELKKLGIDKLIKKPFDHKELTEAIKKVLEPENI
jgi:FixJ family two-component response regulator